VFRARKSALGHASARGWTVTSTARDLGSSTIWSRKAWDVQDRANGAFAIHRPTGGGSARSAARGGPTTVPSRSCASALTPPAGTPHAGWLICWIKINPSPGRQTSGMFIRWTAPGWRSFTAGHSNWNRCSRALSRSTQRLPLRSTRRPTRSGRLRTATVAVGRVEQVIPEATLRPRAAPSIAV
jgi:hypothetical protein